MGEKDVPSNHFIFREYLYRKFEFVISYLIDKGGEEVVKGEWLGVGERGGREEGR